MHVNNIFWEIILVNKANIRYFNWCIYITISSINSYDWCMETYTLQFCWLFFSTIQTYHDKSKVPWNVLKKYFILIYQDTYQFAAKYSYTLYHTDNIFLWGKVICDSMFMWFIKADLFQLNDMEYVINELFLSINSD